MDQDKKANRYDWLPAHMPRVAKLVRERRAQLGDAHVNECWRRGVLQCEPGWFFAREGALTVGTPWDEPVMANLSAASVTSSQAVLILREKADGAK